MRFVLLLLPLALLETALAFTGDKPTCVQKCSECPFESVCKFSKKLCKLRKGHSGPWKNTTLCRQIYWDEQPDNHFEDDEGDEDE